MSKYPEFEAMTLNVNCRSILTASSPDLKVTRYKYSGLCATLIIPTKSSANAAK